MFRWDREVGDSVTQRDFLAGLVPWEDDDAEMQSVATVVFPDAISQPLDYLVPDRLGDRLKAGMRVAVPLGHRRRPATAYCVSVEVRRTTRMLKSIQSVLDDVPLLSSQMLTLTRWISDRYLCTWGEAIQAAVPAGVRGQSGTREVAFLSVNPEYLQQTQRERIGPKQSRIIEHLIEIGEPVPAPQLAEAVGCTMAPIMNLRKKRILLAEIRRIRSADLHIAPQVRQQRIRMNSHQQAACDAIVAALRERRANTFLLFGVTGSGKTEVYLQAIAEAVSYGRQAIVLVPEISLTPQTRERFSARFDKVAVLHSHLSGRERHAHWKRIADGDVQVVVGARSAVFAPTCQLGLIVIDEEHESSFKQESTPRYHVRQVALKRAELAGVPLVLGSATPSLESWHAAQTGRYSLLEMPHRVLDRPLPDVLTVDLREEGSRSSSGISRKLHHAMEAALRDGGQVILLLNRRGYSTHVQCPKCGFVIQCPHCDIAMTHHREGETILCHYCEFSQRSPSECPQCRYPGIHFRGLGTQRLEAEIRRRFQGYNCLRMDTDTMRRANLYEQALERFRSGEVRILLGTQMIAKGLDFPKVTLVGVINADVGLHLPDFRASERTFQLITQVAGRSGRGPKGGRVLVQTFTPEHASIQAAARHDYLKLAADELPCRKKLGYPPFNEMIRLVFRGPKLKPLTEFAEHVASELRILALQRELELRLLGPAPAPIAKLRGLLRQHLQLHSHDGETMRNIVRDCQHKLQAPDNIQWIADVDPLSML